jgi:HSP20 family protein
MMANVSFYEPFDRTFEPLLRAWLQPVSFAKEDVAAVRLDISEDGNAYYVSADLPGIGKDQIAVTIEKNIVTISAERKEPANGENVKRILNERTLGKFTRSITLSDEIDAEAASARHADGVLTLTLPRRTAALGRKLAIE